MQNPGIPQSVETLSALAGFLRRHSHVLVRFPYLLYQQAANEPDESVPCRLADNATSPRPWLRLGNKLEARRERILTITIPEIVPAVTCWAPDGRRFIANMTSDTLALYDLESGARGVVFAGHTGGVSSCQWSPRGDRILSTSLGGQLKIWEVRTGTCVRTLSSGGDGLVSGDWSPGGDRVVTTSESGTLQLWDPDGSRCIGLRRDMTNGACAWGPTGLIATACADHTVKLWDPNTGTSVAVLSGHTAEVRDLAWSLSGDRIVSASKDGLLFVWDAATGSRLRGFLHHATAVSTCAWGRDDLIASGDEYGQLIVWRASDDRILWRTDTGAMRLFDCAWSPGGKDLLTGTDDGTVIAWRPSVENSEVRSSALRTTGPFAWCPDGELIVSAEQRLVRVVDSTTCKLVAMLMAQDQYQVAGLVAAFAWSPDGALIASGAEGGILLFDAKTSGFPLAGTLTAAGRVSSLQWSPDCRYLAAETTTHLIVWEVVHRAVIASLPVTSYDCKKFIWSSRSDKVLLLSNGRLSLWEIATGQLLAMLWSENGKFVDFSWPRDSSVLSAGPAGDVRTWNLSSGETREMETVSGSEVLTCDWAPDLTRFAAGFFRGMARAWTSAGTVIGDCRLPSKVPGASVWSPDSATLLTRSGIGAGLGRDVSVWDPQHGGPPMTFVCDGDVSEIAWNSTGDRLLISDNARRLYIVTLEACNPSSAPDHLPRGQSESSLAPGPVGQCPGCGLRFVCYQVGAAKIPLAVNCPACVASSPRKAGEMAHPARSNEEIAEAVSVMATFFWMFQSYFNPNLSTARQALANFLTITRETMGDFNLDGFDETHATRRAYALKDAGIDLLLPRWKRLGQILTKEERLVFLRAVPRLAGQQIETMDKIVEAVVGLAALEMGVRWDRETRTLSVD